jgi:hypothetical protein
MFKRGLTREQASEIAVTDRVTGPSPVVTGRIAIPAGPILRHKWTMDERLMCQLMHYAVVKAIDVEDRIGSRVGQRNIRAFSIETTTLAPAHKDDEPRVARPGVRGVEVDLSIAVWETIYAMAAVELYPVQLVIAIAIGTKWSRLVARDRKGRGEKMLGYIRLNALYRMWLASGERLLPMLLEVTPRLREELAGDGRRRHQG